MAGSSIAVEARDSVSAMGFARAFCVWRASICFLSAGIVDAGWVDQRGLSLECGVSDLHMDCARARGRIDVCAGAPVA